MRRAVLWLIYKDPEPARCPERSRWLLGPRALWSRPSGGVCTGMASLLPPLWPLPIHARCPSWKCLHPAQPSGSTRPRAPVQGGLRASAPVCRPYCPSASPEVAVLQATAPVPSASGPPSTPGGPGRPASALQLTPLLSPPLALKQGHRIVLHVCPQTQTPRPGTLARPWTVQGQEEGEAECLRPGRGGPAMTRGTGRSSALPPQARRLPSPGTSRCLDISLFHPRHRG